MQEIADWLKSLGMAEYAQRFAENDVDCTILGDLTDQDLKDLGVVSLGHRRKLLRAIAASRLPRSGQRVRRKLPLRRRRFRPPLHHNRKIALARGAISQ
jgi:hypothetical protein